MTLAAEIVDDEEVDVIELPPLDPVAPKALDQKNAAQASLDALNAETPRLSVARSQGHPGAAETLRKHLAAIDAAKAEFDLADAAYGGALEQDGAGKQRLLDAIRNLPPEDAVIGITARDCCDLCGGDNGCILLGGVDRCAHPRKGGAPIEYHNDRLIRSFRNAAEREILAAETDNSEDDD